MKIRQDEAGGPLSSCGVDRGVLKWGSICHDVTSERLAASPHLSSAQTDEVTQLALRALEGSGWKHCCLDSSLVSSRNECPSQTGLTSPSTEPVNKHETPGSRV